MNFSLRSVKNFADGFLSELKNNEISPDTISENNSLISMILE